MRVFIDRCGTLASDVASSAFSGAGHEVVCPDDDADTVSLQQLALSADLIVLDAVLTSEPAASNSAASARDFMAQQLGILGALRHSQHLKTGRKQRLVLLSSMTTWGKTAVAEGHHTHEGLYLQRAPLAGASRLRHLEDDVLRLRGAHDGALETCVIGCGCLVGLGEDWLFPLFLDAWRQQPVRIPGGLRGDASHRLPILQARDLAAFLVALTTTTTKSAYNGSSSSGVDPNVSSGSIDTLKPFPKPYMLACNEEYAASLATVAAAVSAALGTGEVTIVGDGASSVADQSTFGLNGNSRGAAVPWTSMLSLDVQQVAMQNSVFHRVVEKPRAKIEAAEAARAAEAAAVLAAQDAASKRTSSGNGTSRAGGTSKGNTARSASQTGRSRGTARSGGKASAGAIPPPPPPAPGFATACKLAASEFAASRGLTPLRVGIWSAPGAGGGALARDLAQHWKLAPEATEVNVASAVSYVRQAGRALLTRTAAQKQQQDSAAKARVARHAAHLAAVAAAAEKGEEAPPEEGEPEDPYEVGSHPDVLAALAATVIPPFDDLKLFDACGGDELGLSGLGTTGAGDADGAAAAAAETPGSPESLPPANELPRDVQLACVRAYLTHCRPLRLQGWALAPGLLASRQEAIQLFAQPQLAPAAATVATVAEDGDGAAIKEASDSTANGSATTQSDPGAADAAGGVPAGPPEWDSALFPTSLVVLDGPDDLLQAAHTQELKEVAALKAAVKAAAAEGAEPSENAGVVAEEAEPAQVAEAFAEELSRFRTNAADAAAWLANPEYEADLVAAEASAMQTADEEHAAAVAQHEAAVAAAAAQAEGAAEGSGEGQPQSPLPPVWKRPFEPRPSCLTRGLGELFSGAFSVPVLDVGADWHSGLLPNRPAVLAAVASASSGATDCLCAHAYLAAEAASVAVSASDDAATEEDEAFFARWMAGDLAAEPLEVPVAPPQAPATEGEPDADAGAPTTGGADDAAGPALAASPAADTDALPPAPTLKEGVAPKATPEGDSIAGGVLAGVAGGVTAAERSALAKRAAGHQEFLLKHVMPTLTYGMLRVVREAPADPIEFLADFLCFQGKLAEARAAAQAKLQFVGLVAKAQWIEMMEKAEEEEAARQAAGNEDDE